MRKTKLVISDLHVHTGPRLPDGRRNVFEEFSEDDLLIEFLEHFSSGEHAADDLELIINGDFFNLLEIIGDNRATETITAEVAVAHLERIFAGHPDLFDALHDFARREHKSLTFIVGNHDAALLFPEVQRALHQRLGRQVEIKNYYSYGGVFIIHGHQYEFIHSFDMRDFTHRDPDGVECLKLPYGSLFVIQFLRRMKSRRPYIDKVKPFEKYLRWAFWNDHLFFWRVIFGIIGFWSVNRFSRDPYRRREFALSPMRFLNAMTHKSLPRTAEDILRQTNYKLVVMGHSHKIDYHLFGNFREYFNTGTWTEIISVDVAQLGRSYLRPYVKIDFENDAPRASLHNWIGSHRLTHELIP